MVLCLVKKVGLYAMSASESNVLSRCENPREMITCILRAPVCVRSGTEVCTEAAQCRSNVSTVDHFRIVAVD